MSSNNINNCCSHIALSHSTQKSDCYQIVGGGRLGEIGYFGNTAEKYRNTRGINTPPPHPVARANKGTNDQFEKWWRNVTAEHYQELRYDRKKNVRLRVSQVCSGKPVTTQGRWWWELLAPQGLGWVLPLGCPCCHSWWGRSSHPCLRGMLASFMTRGNQKLVSISYRPNCSQSLF